MSDDAELDLGVGHAGADTGNVGRLRTARRRGVEVGVELFTLPLPHAAASIAKHHEPDDRTIRALRRTATSPNTDSA